MFPPARVEGSDGAHPFVKYLPKTPPALEVPIAQRPCGPRFKCTCERIRCQKLVSSVKEHVQNWVICFLLPSINTVLDACQ